MLGTSSNVWLVVLSHEQGLTVGSCSISTKKRMALFLHSFWKKCGEGLFLADSHWGHGDAARSSTTAYLLPPLEYLLPVDSHQGEGDAARYAPCTHRPPLETLASFGQPSSTRRMRQIHPYMPVSSGESWCRHADWEKQQLCHHALLAAGEASV